MKDKFVKLWKQSYKSFMLLPKNLPDIVLKKIIEEVELEIKINF